MKFGSAAVIVVALGAPGLGLALGCSHQATPVAEPVVAPDERPPLPPEAGTPIGHLVDAAADLKLSDDQLTKLKAINDELAGKLAIDQTEMVPEPVAPPPREQKGRGLGFRAGGDSSSGAGTAGGFPGVATGTGTGDDGTHHYIIPASTVGHVYRERARHVHDAIEHAFALLDVGQKVIARRVLTDHGVNVDTGEVTNDEPGAAKLEDPKPGKPLPRESEP